ncbi:unnamed protein product [Brassica napus]|uniref:(rape) hypothetical protein n=1 Tax=Brassica napus TaxID=3708 RepID=A0A816SI59_BRANA|nr:unnamed protein product [Brassica napus]
MDRLLHKNGDLTKLERYHNRRPWFYREKHKQRKQHCSYSETFLSSTKKGLFCKPSLTRTILPLQDDLKVVQAKFAKTEVVQDEGLDSRDHWSRVMKGHTGDNMVSY